MKKFVMALAAATLATGLAFAADDAEKPAARPSAAPMPRLSDFDPSRIPAMREQDETLISRWQEALGRARGDEAKKALGDAIATAKEVGVELKQLSDALQSGKDDDARQATAKLAEKRPELLHYVTIVPTYLDLDQMKSMQAERGKDNPELNAHFQRMIELLNKKLDLQNQISAVNADLWKERQAMQQLNEAAAAKPPASEPVKPATASTAAQ